MIAAAGFLLSDVARWAVIALGSLVVGAIAVVVAIHWRAFRAAPRGYGLLPLHVALIGTSHGGLIAMLALASVDSLGRESISWRFGVYIVCCLLTLVALWVIATFQWRRMVHERGTTVVEGVATTIRPGRRAS
ncbi:hypothetical protein [Actinomycetospora termitidis]|uniref:Uncharacterized protein n=1 Tax=Actinomycetospora termitidis TaxID=3053470 RepID=A0ABT7MFE4_9PSEU|nr:hypothetical protein [Actinomycetospora sp. Odt1-22]MDL5159391.1 hypothetical protein [Actinomycetospora sp. Odt1-22]